MVIPIQISTSPNRKTAFVPKSSQCDYSESSVLMVVQFNAPKTKLICNFYFILHGSLRQSHHSNCPLRKCVIKYDVSPHLINKAELLSCRSESYVKLLVAWINVSDACCRSHNVRPKELLRCTVDRVKESVHFVLPFIQPSSQQIIKLFSHPHQRMRHRYFATANYLLLLHYFSK